MLRFESLGKTTRAQDTMSAIHKECSCQALESGLGCLLWVRRLLVLRLLVCFARGTHTNMSECAAVIRSHLQSTIATCIDGLACCPAIN